MALADPYKIALHTMPTDSSFQIPQLMATITGELNLNSLIC